MKIAAVCCTFNRPKLLGRMIRCFELQDYPDRELIILSDNDQYATQSGDRWKLVSHRFRYPTLGDKRNAAMALISPDVAAVATWDDDDLDLPWQLSAIIEALEDAQWVQPRQVLLKGNGRFEREATFRQGEPENIAYPGGWGFRREAFERLGGYNAISNGEDRELAQRARVLLGASADTISPHYPTPGYVWTRDAERHLSAMGPGEKGYRELGRQRIEPVKKLDISWPEEYTLWPVGENIAPRRW